MIVSIVHSVFRIHAFLEYSELINYATNPEIFTFPPAQVEDELLDFSKSGEHPNPLMPELTLQPNVFKKIFAFCRECSIRCPRSRWHHESGFDLCAECYGNGKFDVEYHSSQFMHVEAPSISLEDNWEPEETLTLLRAIFKYRENMDWQKISEEVQDRTKEDCMLHFIRLPSQDNYLESKIQEWMKIGPDDECDDSSPEQTMDAMDLETKKYDEKEVKETKSIATALDEIEKENLPFISTYNPVMALLTFLASQVGTSVAEAAAKSGKEFVSTLSKEEKESAKDMDDDKKTAKKEPVAREQILGLYKCVLQAATQKACEMQAEEEEKIRSLTEQAVTLVLGKIKVKLAQLEKIEQKLEQETKSVSFCIFLLWLVLCLTLVKKLS